MYRSLYLDKIRDQQTDYATTTNAHFERRRSDFLSIQVNELSLEDRKLLHETFNLFEKDLTTNGLRIFLQLALITKFIYLFCMRTLSENPDYKYFWPQFRAIPDSSLISSSVLRNFAHTYMNALKKIVESLNNEQMPYEVLQRISAKHARHNIQMHHMQKMIKPLLENVRRALGRHDENAERAWETLFQTVGAIVEHYKTSQV
uniref:BMA-GLB-14 n=1 Tax=Brugia malayi TaxID=6279 RepID=A0A0J9XV05_BRUMA|nr:BMA-GLB-14 [Brugia malayi]